MSDLTTTDKDNLVDAINELDSDIGNLSDLTTTDTSSIVNAINEVDAKVKQPTWIVHGDGVKTYGEMLDELYAMIKDTVNAMNWVDKRRLSISTRFGSWYVSAVGSSVLEFYGVHNMLDTGEGRTWFAFKLAITGSEVWRVIDTWADSNISTPAVTTHERWTNNVSFNTGDDFTIMLV